MIAKITEKVVFDGLLKSNKKVFVDFFAQWCGPCKFIEPHIENFSKTYTNISFAKVDVDIAEDLVSEYRIESMPTFIAFHNGRVIDRIIGSDKLKIEKVLKNLDALN